MDPDFKAFIVALTVAPFALAFVAVFERLGVITLDAYTWWQVFTTLVVVAFGIARHHFKK
jgi:uncharacterized membrane protein